MSSSILCQAIARRLLLAFDYQGLPRVVAPYCHGVSPKGTELLRAVQIRGASRSGGLGFGKLWTVSKLSSLRLTNETFAPDDPQYNPADRAMETIHCRVI